MEGMGAFIASRPRSAEIRSEMSRANRENGTAVYAVVNNRRSAKRDLSIPRLAHMATNLLVNVCSALPKEPKPLMFAWLDNTVALH